MNIWKQFQSLIPGRPLLVATVTTVNADGTSTVTLPDGAVLRVRGTSVAEGNKAFVRDGIIEGEAPNLTASELEI